MFESYLPIKCNASLRSSNSMALFAGRPKNLSFQLNPTSDHALKGLDLSFNHVVSQTPTKDFQQQLRKKMRGSKSCGKCFNLAETDKLNLSSYSNFTRLESIYAPEKKNTLYKEIMSSSKKAKAVKAKCETNPGNTLSRISEELKKINKADTSLAVYSTALPYSSHSKPKRSSILNNSTVSQASRKLDRHTTASSVKRKRSRENVFVRGKSDADQVSEIDSAANITDTTTAQRFEDHYNKSQHSDHSKALGNKLLNNLKGIERSKDKLRPEEISSKKFATINDTLNEIINNDHAFGEILKLLQSKLSELNTESTSVHKAQTDSLKSELDKAKLALANDNVRIETLNNEKAKLAKENGEKSAVIEKQKTSIQELKKQLNETQNQAQDNINELSQNVGVLYKENKKLAGVVKKLFTELKKSKKREGVLSKLLKGDHQEEADAAEPMEEEEEDKKKALNKTMVEVGKKKVKIPVLDFSKLAPKKPTRLKVVTYYNNHNNGKGNADNINSESAGESEGQEMFVQEDDGDDDNGEVEEYTGQNNTGEGVQEIEEGEEGVVHAEELDNFLGQIGAVSETISCSAKTN